MLPSFFLSNSFSELTVVTETKESRTNFLTSGFENDASKILGSIIFAIVIVQSSELNHLVPKCNSPVNTYIFVSDNCLGDNFCLVVCRTKNLQNFLCLNTSLDLKGNPGRVIYTSAILMS
jgi:hypothetical protein